MASSGNFPLLPASPSANHSLLSLHPFAIMCLEFGPSARIAIHSSASFPASCIVGNFLSCTSGKLLLATLSSAAVCGAQRTNSFIESINSSANVLGIMKIHKRGLMATTPGNGRDKDIRMGEQERAERRMIATRLMQTENSRARVTINHKQRIPRNELVRYLSCLWRCLHSYSFE